jgi:nitrogen regulatory protein P-II 1
MKRIEAIIKQDKLDDIVKAIHSVGVGGLTVGECQGHGTDEPPLVGDFYSKKWIVTIVPDDKVSDIMSAIANAGCTQHKGDGKIFVSNIEQAMDICTKEKELHI